ncbi:serine/threonine-protein kinase [Sorangium sp. So ce1335]|uniref:serine/threonine-protein kinase n=1 Tax=Sorangium sp. So ce1335 TaxID=3133335 RepID=UPI003F5E3B2D
MSAVVLAEGTVFARRYRVVRLIAAGAMGAVHEVVHLETERHRALKVMHPHLFQSEEMRERFKREARIAAKVESEHIVDVFDAGVDEATGMPFLVMELLRGEELGERLKRVGRLPPAEAMTYLHQAALALDRTHAANIVHRDLKPANIFLSWRDDGSVRVKILDFGVAKLVAEGATAAGATSSLGTPIYMPPEQFLGGTRLTGAADIFALGMLAYTLLVGGSYWHPEASGAESVLAFAMVAARGPEEPPVQRARSMGVALPPGFDAWFARATAGDPAARFRRATEAVQALGEVLGVPVAAGRGTFLSASSSPGVVPAATALPPGPAAPEPALAGSPVPARDGRPSGLGLAGTSTGAAVSAVPAGPARRRRAPLVAGVALLGLGAMLGASVRLAQRPRHTAEQAVALDAAAVLAAPEPPLPAPQATQAAPPPAPPEPLPSVAAPDAVPPPAPSPSGSGATAAPGAGAATASSPAERYPSATSQGAARTPGPAGSRPSSTERKPPPSPRPIPAELFGRK